MTVAVLSALHTELELILDSMQIQESSSIAGWPMWSGSVGEVPVVLARAGLGKVNTAALSALLWERCRPTLFVFTGVAGGLDPALGVGDLVVAETTIQHDAGVVTPHGGLERYQPGHIPFFNPTDEFGFRPSGRLLELVRQLIPAVAMTPVLGRPPAVVFGKVLTGDVFLQDEKTRDRLFAELGAQAIEMEGAALGQIASRLGVDHLVIRSLSDLAMAEADEDFDRFLPEVSANSARLVLGLLNRLQEDEGDLTVGS